MDKKIYFGGSQPDFQGVGGSQKTDIEAGLPKKGDMDSFIDLRVEIGKKEGVVFLMGS